MRGFSLPIENKHGSVLVITMLTLVLLTLIGISATTTSNIETQIAGNEKFYKTAFFAADGGTEAGRELLEQNIASAGFATSDGLSPNTKGEIVVGNIAVPSTSLYMNTAASSMPTDQNRDAYFPNNYTANNPHTNLTITGNAMLSTGSALQMCAGYEGIGKGSAGGGGHTAYDIWSRYNGISNSDATIRLQWRHVW